MAAPFESGPVRPRTAEQKRASRVARGDPKRVRELKKPAPVAIARFDRGELREVVLPIGAADDVAQRLIAAGRRS